MGAFPKSQRFEHRYFEQIREHLLDVCSIAAPSGDALQFGLMLRELANGRSWIIFRKPGIQPTLYVDESDPWICRRKRTDLTRLPQLVIVDLDPPKLNGLTEKWIDEWIADEEVREQLCGDVRRNGSNVELLKASLEGLLSRVDEIRRNGDWISPLEDA